jgi:hypothetical protein
MRQSHLPLVSVNAKRTVVEMTLGATAATFTTSQVAQRFRGSLK